MSKCICLAHAVSRAVFTTGNNVEYVERNHVQFMHKACYLHRPLMPQRLAQIRGRERGCPSTPFFEESTLDCPLTVLQWDACVRLAPQSAIE